jgi:hypothetical protein
MYHDDEEETGFAGVIDLDETADDFDVDVFPGSGLDEDLVDEDEPLSIASKLVDDEAVEETEELE